MPISGCTIENEESALVDFACVIAALRETHAKSISRRAGNASSNSSRRPNSGCILSRGGGFCQGFAAQK